MSFRARKNQTSAEETDSRRACINFQSAEKSILAKSATMASQCQFLSSTSRLFSPCATSSSSSSSKSCNQHMVFLRGQRLQSRSRGLVQCVASSSDKNGEERQQQQQKTNNAMAALMAKAPEPIRVFPWATAGSLFLQRLLHQFWIVGKWLAIPVLAVSMLSELSYTLMQEKVLIIPVGMIGGVAFAGLMQDTALELSTIMEARGQVPWHLVLLGLFFGALKFMGPYLPVWGRISVPHFANGGLWQVIRLVIDWRKQHAHST